MKTILGTCSICGGRVTVPTVYHSIYPPTPTCDGCGATPKGGHGPLIEMDRPSRPDHTSGGQGRRASRFGGDDAA